MKDYLLYIAASITTIGMVLAQEDKNDQERVIYYLNKSVLDSKTQYSRVEKLALDTIIYVYCFCHYILLRTTTIIVDLNPMYYILTH